MRKMATAYLLEEGTIPAIVEQTGIEEEVLRGWLIYDQNSGLLSKVIVVEIIQDKEEL